MPLAMPSARSRDLTGHPPAKRQFELDWLRALVVLGLIPIHAAVIFSTTTDVFIKNAQQSTLMALLGTFAGAWGMPLLFVVAGAAAYFALTHRTAKRYLLERTQRLIIPFLFATLTIIPLQVYAIVSARPDAIRAFPLPVHDPRFAHSFGSFYVEYLRDYGYTLTHFAPSLIIIFWGHLWFIPRLLAYALLTLPLFMYLRTPSGMRAVARAGQFLSLPAMIFLPAVVLALTEMALRPGWLARLTAHWPVYDDWVQFVFFLLYFIYGYLIYASSDLRATVRRSGRMMLSVGVVAFGFALLQHDTLTTNPLNYSLGYIGGIPLRSFVSWFWVVAILAFSMRFLTFSNGLLRYLNEAAFPVYVIHMPVVTIVGVLVITLDLNLYLKFALIIVLALAIALLTFDVAIKRIAVLRFLFGVKLAPTAEPERRAAFTPAFGSSSNRRITMEDEISDMQYLAWPATPIQPSDFEDEVEHEAGHRHHGHETPVSAELPVVDPATTPALPIPSEPTLAQVFRNRSELFADSLRWKAWRNGTWLTMTWRENQTLVHSIIAGLTSLGVRPGERIGILSETRWEWMAADWAILNMGAVCVTIYPSIAEETIQFILTDAEVTFLFLQDGQQYAKIQAIRGNLPALRKIIIFDDTEGLPADPDVVSFSALRTLSKLSTQEQDNLARRYAAAIRPEMPASIIYTSGTTNRPKGAIHTQASMLAQVRSTGVSLTTFRPGMSHLLILPLAHVLGREEHLLAFERGGVTVIGESIHTVARDIREVKPNILVGVPRIYEKAYAAIKAQARAGNAFTWSAFRIADSIGERVVELREKNARVPVHLRLGAALADTLVFRRVREALGGHIVFSVTGGAPVERRILLFFHAAGILVLEGWGLTETMGAVAVNRPEKYRLGTVGPATQDHEVRIAEDGEVLVRGPCVFAGYLNNPAENRAALDSEGWLHTGDTGTIDADGFLTIIGRKKELIITSGGKKVVPDHVESLLKGIHVVSQAAVFGDRQPYLVALLTLDEQGMRAWAADRGIVWSDMKTVMSTDTFKAYLKDMVARVNRHLAHYETIKRFMVVPDDFTPENNLLTPTEKIRRQAIMQRYQRQIESLYAGNEETPGVAGKPQSQTTLPVATP